MKWGLTIAAITFLFVTSPVLAQSNHSNDNNDSRNFINAQTINIHNSEHNEDEDSDKDENKTKLSANSQNPTPSTIPCDPSEKWKNHGAFVSCVAHLHHDKDDNDVEDGAHSDIGKHNLASPTPTNSISPIPTETIAPSESPTPSITLTPTASDTPTPDISDLDTFKTPKNNIGSILNNLVAFFAHLL